MQKNNISRAKHDFCEIIKILQCMLSFISIYIIHPKTSNFRENSSVNLPLFIRALQFLENDRKKGIKIFLYNGGNPYWGGCLQKGDKLSHKNKKALSPFHHKYEMVFFFVRYGFSSSKGQRVEIAIIEELPIEGALKPSWQSIN